MVSTNPHRLHCRFLTTQQNPEPHQYHNLSPPRFVGLAIANPTYQSTPITLPLFGNPTKPRTSPISQPFTSAFCWAAGVPTPPDWGTGGWVSKGILTNEFISEDSEAEVFTYNSNTPEGMCIALPRSNGNTISLLGIICLGKSSSNACFWDNQQDDRQFPIQKDTIVPISQFAGGADLDGGTGGVCTSCHAGENPYIIHPGTALGLPNLSGLPIKANNWYKPLVHPSWPQNIGPTNILDSISSPGKCTSCHTTNVSGGRFPWLSTKLIGFCGTILPKALERTMPPGSPNNQNYAAHINALNAACNTVPDVDRDGVDDFFDNCPSVANPDQRDTDGDKQGDACDDDDDDDDTCKDNEDQHPLDANPVVAKLPSIPNTCPNNVVRVFEGNDTDKDGIPNCKDTDDDNDDIPDGQDTCPTVKPDRNILSLGCGFGITSCPLIKINVLGVCFGSTCIEDFRIKLDWVVNLINPPVEVATFDRFWIEGSNLYISKGSLSGNRNPLQTIANQLSIAPDSVSTGWFRLSIWSRNTSQSQSQLQAVVAEYAPNQISVLGNNFTGSSIRLSLPNSSSGKLLIENSDKAEPTKIDKKVENNYSTYFSTILILVAVAVITLIAIKK